MDITNEVGVQDMEPTVPAPETDATDENATPSDLALVKRIQKTIVEDKAHHEKAFKRMQRDMFVAYHGRDEKWDEGNYTANIAGRHVKQKTAALYAKNPKIVARRRETLDFVIWDENPQSLETAMKAIQMAQQAVSAAPMRPDPMTGEAVPAEPPIPPQYEEAVNQATALMQDFKDGMQRRQQIARIGKTLEVLFAQAMREQKPQDFKRLLKAVVRRACTTGVGYVELGFQREYGPRPGLTEQLADQRTRLDHLRRLAEEVSEGEIEQDDAEMAELERSVKELQSEQEVIMREGLIFDAPQSTKVIPDRMCRHLDGFVGASHLTVEYLFTTAQVEEMFQGVDLKKNYVGYTSDGKSGEKSTSVNYVQDDNGEYAEAKPAGKDLVCVWKHYDKPSGMVYYVADGHPNFLRLPAAPDVFVEDFWPVYSLTFNAVESESQLFPPSDVGLLLHMQEEYNRSRQGLREHRKAARPRWVSAKGAFGEDDLNTLKNLHPFEIGFMNIDPQTKIGDLLQAVPVPGVDPNLYETNPIFTDTQLVVGSQEAQFGGVAKATATESAIAANSTASNDQSSSDDLDSFLTVIARAAGQILMKEMSEEQVMKVAGPGAIWPQMTLAEIADEIYLEVEAGSTGKPNQAIAIENWKQMMPFLIQMPGIQPIWLARETLRRLDDRMDLTDALADGLPSIVMQNQMQQPGTGDAATDPNAQGPQGANKTPQPAPEAGSDPAFGSNQV